MSAACPRCSYAGPHAETASGPHRKLSCGSCGRYIKFLAKDKPQRDPEAWRWKVPTPKQLEIIGRSPKWSWVEPQNRWEAWQLVGQILREAEEAET